MAIKLSGTQFANTLAGLENYSNDAFNFTVTAHVLTPGQVSKWTTSRPINNSSAISSIQINYGGIETVWRYTSGALTVNYASNTYQIETITYYSGTNLNVETYIVNLTGGNLNISQFFVNVRVALFNAPF